MQSSLVSNSRPTEPSVPSTGCVGLNDSNFKQLFGEIQSLTLSEQQSTPLSDNVGTSSTPTDNVALKNILLERVANSDAHFKNQLVSEPDLTHSEKRQIAADILERKPGIFLERFGKHLVASDLTFFEQFAGDFYVEYYLKELAKRLNVSKEHNKKTIRNRRYEAMKRLVSVGDYFSDDEMKQRDPMMYEDMIGQHLSEEEISQMVGQSEPSLSGMLLKHLQVMQNNERYGMQKEEEECQVEEEDEEEEEEEENMSMEEEKKGSEDKVISDEEKAALRCEFLSTMQERFLKGEDHNFNYSEVDNNPDYDAVDLLNIDAEEKYFDNDDGELDDCIRSRSQSSLNSESPISMAEGF